MSESVNPVNPVNSVNSVNQVKLSKNRVKNAVRRLNKNENKEKKAANVVTRAKYSITRANNIVGKSADELAHAVSNVSTVAAFGKDAIAKAAGNLVDAEENSNISKNQKKKFKKQLFNVITKTTHKNEVAKANEKRARKRWRDDNLNLAFAILIGNAAVAKLSMFETATAAATAVYEAAVLNDNLIQ